MFYFHLDPWEMIQIDEHIFFKGVGSTTNHRYNFPKQIIHVDESRKLPVDVPISRGWS